MIDGTYKNLKLKLLSSFITTALLGVFVVLAIVMYLNPSLGWFANNKEVNGSNMLVTMDAPQAEADFSVYVYDAKLSSVRYTDDGLDEDPRLDDLKMQIHDVIFKSRNRYTPAIIQIHLSNINSDYLSGGVVYVTLGRNNDAAYNEVNGVQSLPKKSTSVLRFTLASNTAWYDSDPDVLYSNIDTALYTPVVVNQDYTGVSSAVFTTVTGQGNATRIEKTSTISLSLSYSSSDIVNGALDMYLYITYDQNLVNRFEQSAGIDTSGTAAGKVSTMENDITNFIISLSA